MRHFILLSALLLSSCSYIEQIRETRRLDAEYQVYLEKEKAGSTNLHKLHAAAANATKVQVHIIPDMGGVQEQIIPLSDEEVATLRDIFPRLKDLPPLSREAWENRENGNYPYMSVCWVSFDKLEFLDAEGNVLADMFLNTGIAEEEEMGAELQKFEQFTPHYMLPAADRKRFYAIPAIKK